MHVRPEGRFEHPNLRSAVIPDAPTGGMLIVSLECPGH